MVNYQNQGQAIQGNTGAEGQNINKINSPKKLKGICPNRKAIFKKLSYRFKMS